MAVTDRLTVVPCGSAKLAHEAPAWQLYTGSYHRACQAVARSRGGEWVILSALHGFLLPDEIVAPYDVRFPMRGTVTVEKLREQIVALGLDPSLVIALGGKEYVSRTAAAFEGRARVIAPYAGQGMGKQIHAMRRDSRA